MEKEPTPSNKPELPKGVGSTSLMIAIARIEARKLPNPPFSDPFATPLAAPLYDAETDSYPIMNKLAAKDAGSPGFVASIAIRTLWFDHQVTVAIQKGIKQFVNLGAGMDTRAYRFDYAEGSHFYEVDFPEVLEYKNSVLEKAGFQPKCVRHCLTADITQEGWIERLKEHGYNPQEPTLWFMEGLTMYLEEKDNKDMFTKALASSGVGSMAAVLTLTEEMMADFNKPDGLLKGLNILLKYGTSDPGSLLSGCGWTVGEVTTHQEACAAFGRQDLFNPASAGGCLSLGYKA